MVLLFALTAILLATSTVDGWDEWPLTAALIVAMMAGFGILGALT